MTPNKLGKKRLANKNAKTLLPNLSAVADLSTKFMRIPAYPCNAYKSWLKLILQNNEFEALLHI